MKYKIIYEGKVIGESDLENYDDGMNVHQGRFFPSKEYERVRNIFQLFMESQPKDSSQPVDEEKLKLYFSLRDKLNLSVIGENNSRLGGVVHIEDYSSQGILDEYSISVLPN